MEYRPGTGLPVEHVFDKLLELGLTVFDIAHIERLSDPKIVPAPSSDPSHEVLPGPGPRHRLLRGVAGDAPRRADAVGRDGRRGDQRRLSLYFRPRALGVPTPTRLGRRRSRAPTPSHSRSPSSPSCPAVTPVSIEGRSAETSRPSFWYSRSTAWASIALVIWRSFVAAASQAAATATLQMFAPASWSMATARRSTSSATGNAWARPASKCADAAPPRGTGSRRQR